MREVTEDTTSTGDRLIWGAIGTLMELDVKNFFTEWTPKLKDLREAAAVSKSLNEAAQLKEATEKEAAKLNKI